MHLVATISYTVYNVYYVKHAFRKLLRGLAITFCKNALTMAFDDGIRVQTEKLLRNIKMIC